ncbi:hypothetical protein GCM10007390_21860 [Persicitalea jodogahamensis]|uniref:Uncharacterized protein n=2 Tax=Persicitalea jodogahamensis TaxID=402147 RepID=A0A8J3D8F3_9BACT|nr:hypothetical protein GCM10007390_21860 [Persicitalea jodogahamensis]
MPCGPGGTNPGGGDPIDVPGLPSPFAPPSSPSGLPIHVGGGGPPSGTAPTIPQDAINRIYTALTINSWEAQGVNVTDEERAWLFQNPQAINPLDIFVGTNLGAAVEKWSFGLLGNFIRHILTSDFEKRMFDRYWTGQGGTYHLTNAEFSDIIAQGSPETSRTPTTYLNQNAFEQGWTWYHTERYNAALGRARVYIRASDDHAFGLIDTYDFNPQSGDRDMASEIFTRIGGTFITAGARPFTIVYP